MEEKYNGNGRVRKMDSKKFMVVVMAFVLMVYCFGVITTLAFMKNSMMTEVINALTLVLPILAGVFPLYLGGNVTQKVMASKNGKK